MQRQQLVRAMDRGMGSVDLSERRVTWWFGCHRLDGRHRPSAEWAAPGNELSQSLPEHGYTLHQDHGVPLPGSGG
jgi:hypothetical protein